MTGVTIISAISSQAATLWWYRGSHGTARSHTLRESSEYDPVAADSADLDMAYPTTYYPGVTNPASGSSIVLHEGEDFIADVILTPTPAVRLRINHANGAPGQPREVTLKQYVFGTMIDPPATRHESRGDTVEILGIPSGKYILEVESSVSTDKVHGRVIELTADSDIDANSASTFPMVSGVVQREGGLTIDRSICPVMELAHRRSPKHCPYGERRVQV